MFQDRGIFKSAAIVLTAGLLVAAGCASETADDQAAAETAVQEDGPAAMGEMNAPHGQVSMIMYNCADEKSFTLTVAEGVGKAALRAEGGTYQLDQQPVGSGMEYSDGSYTFRGKGPEAFVEKDGEPVYTDCVAVGHPEMPATEEVPETPEN